MRVSKVLLACAATSMAAMPVVATAATANPAAKLSISKSVPGSVRASSKRGKSKAIEAGAIVLVFAVGAVAAGTLAATDGDSTPDSQ